MINTRVKENSAQLQLYQYINHYLPETLKTNYVSIHDFDLTVSHTDCFIFSFLNLMIQCKKTFFMETIRYKFSISPPSIYFEVTIITAGQMSIGLAVKQMDIEQIIGQNSFSIGIDGYDNCVWMHKKAYKFKTSRSRWNEGDVIGIYVNFVNRSVIFGINNKIIELDGDPFEEEFIFSILPCHVAASFSEHQQCFFNFDCEVIPKAFLNKINKTNYQTNVHNYNNTFLNKINKTNYQTNVHNYNNINSVLTYGSTASMGNITISGNCIILYFLCSASCIFKNNLFLICLNRNLTV